MAARTQVHYGVGGDIKRVLVSICRKCYVHPEVLNSYMDGNLVLEFKSKAESELRSSMESLQPEEAAVLALLRESLQGGGGFAKAAGTRSLIFPR